MPLQARLRRDRGIQLVSVPFWLLYDWTIHMYMICMVHLLGLY